MKIDPVFCQLLRFTHQNFSLKGSRIHGLSHWQNVWHNAIFLSEKEGLTLLFHSYLLSPMIFKGGQTLLILNMVLAQPID